MPAEIKVPVLGESVSEATVAKWFKKVGDAVKKDEMLLELETDKVTLEVNAPVAGALKEIKAPAGATVGVGALLGLIEEGAAGAQSAEKPAEKKSEPAPAPAPQPAARPAPAGSADRNPPSVRKLVEENKLDASTIPATGKDGRHTKGDVLSALSGGAPATTSDPADQRSATSSSSLPPASVGAPPARRQEAKPLSAIEGTEERVKMSKLRQVIARRLKESQNTAATLTTFNEIDMSALMELRSEYKDVFEKKHGVKLGFMSFFVQAVCGALKEIPEVNAHIEGDEIVYKHYYDIGVAVGTEQGLVVPVIRDADKLSLAGIEKEIGRLAGKARDGSLSMKELTGGTFTVSNGGVYGSLLATPIINPPQSGILGMHKIQERPIAIKGQIVVKPMMYVALSYDHRIIDGRESVTFLVRVKEALEDPRRLVLGI